MNTFCAYGHSRTTRRCPKALPGGAGGRCASGTPAVELRTPQAQRRGLPGPGRTAGGRRPRTEPAGSSGSPGALPSLTETAAPRGERRHREGNANPPTLSTPPGGSASQLTPCAPAPRDKLRPPPPRGAGAPPALLSGDSTAPPGGAEERGAAAALPARSRSRLR